MLTPEPIRLPIFSGVFLGVGGSSGVIGWVEYDVDPFSNELIYSDVFNQEHSLTMLFFLSH